jgi:hypothetical protein
MITLVATIVGLVVWLVLWSLGVKAIDGIQIALVLVLTAEMVRQVAPRLPGNRGS